MIWHIYLQINLGLALERLEVEFLCRHGPGAEQQRAMPGVGPELVRAGALVGRHWHPQYCSSVEHGRANIFFHVMFISAEEKVLLCLCPEIA